MKRFVFSLPYFFCFSASLSSGLWLFHLPAILYRQKSRDKVITQLVQQLHMNKPVLDKIHLLGVRQEQIFSYEDGSLGYKKETIDNLTNIVEEVNKYLADQQEPTSTATLSIAARAERR